MLNRSRRLKTLVVAASAAAFVVVPAAAQAQIPIDPTATPEVINPPLLNWMSYVGVGLALFATLIIVLLYVRYAPRFRRSEADDPAFLRPGIPVQNVQIGGVAARPPAPAPAQTVSVGAPAAAAVAVATPAAPAAPAAAAPAAAAPAATAPAAAAEAASSAEAPAAAAPAEAAAPAKKVEAEIDQETFDRVLQEQLDKGVDRRVAEGRAKSKAVQAARAKAGS